MLKVYSVYDSKSSLFGSPFFIPSEPQARRAFSDVVNDSSTIVSRHPSDFILYQIGEFDESVGLLSSITPVLSLGNASEYKRIQAPIELPKFLGSVVQSDVTNGADKEVVR